MRESIKEAQLQRCKYMSLVFTRLQMHARVHTRKMETQNDTIYVSTLCMSRALILKQLGCWSVHIYTWCRGQTYVPLAGQ